MSAAISEPSQFSVESTFSSEPKTSERIRVILLLWSLQGGGAERTALHLLKKLDPTRFDVRLGLVRKDGPYLAQVDPKRIVGGHIGQLIQNFEEGSNKEIFRFKNLIRSVFLGPFQVARTLKAFRPHVAISFCQGMNIATYAGLKLYRKRRELGWIAREGNNLYQVIEHEVSRPWVRGFLRRLAARAYSSAECFLTISKEQANKFSQDPALRRSKPHTIYNGVDLENLRTKAKEEIELPFSGKFIISVGRLDEQKAFDILLKSYSTSFAKDSHHLVILGSGPEEQKLKAMATELGIQDRVHFLGWKPNPWAWMSRADAFILPSRWEGFGNVVIEAMACGTPVIVSDCDFGPREIVEYGKAGVIFPVDNVGALSDALDKVLNDEKLATSLKENAARRVAHFSVDNIVKNYEKLVLDVSSSLLQ